METVEAFLRAAGMAITLLMAVVFLRDAGRTLVGKLAALFSIGVAAYLLCSSPAFGRLPPYIHIPALALCVANPVFFWLLARTLFDDGFRLSPAHGLLVVALPALKSVEALGSASSAAISEVLLHGAAFGLAAHALWIAYRGRADDLSEQRRAVRLPFVAGVGLYSVAILMAELVVGGGLAPPSVRLLNVAVILVLAAGFALRLISLRADDLVIPAAVAPEAATLQQDREVDAALMGRLNALMEQKQVWRQEGLSIGKLADQLGIPEYRLRRLINKGLGYRNFAAYLNGYRIKAARAALIDPEKRRLPVLTIALDLGFGSIGPFNRAFKDATGMTPTEFRRTPAAGGEGNDLAES